MIALSQLTAAPATEPDPNILGLVEDSRQVQPGDAYVAVQGERHDGHEFAEQAVAQGAVAVLAERRLLRLPVPVRVVPRLRQRRSALAGRVYGNPSQHLNCTAITGTNGKTSVAHYIAQLVALLAAEGVKPYTSADINSCGYMGTLGWGQLSSLQEANLTTADASTVQRRLAQLKAQGCARVAIEVSSHALSQHRVAAVNFSSAIFTNLSRDHLDYHGSMEAYAAAKRSLFDFPSLQRIITNIDDACGRAIGESKQQGSARVYTYGAGQEAGANAASVSWRDIEVQSQGFTGTWCTAWGDAALQVPLLGRFAIANVAAALTLLLSEGLPLAALARAIGKLACVPGRMQQFVNPGGANLVVDFAHTPDALQQAAKSLREHCPGKLVIVFGCGGDRDRGKRAQMGQAAAAVADALIITDDNPRSEDPDDIVADILGGLPKGPAARSHEVCHDRAAAIARAMARSGPEDLILIAGKGHENYQERNGQRVAYSDTACVAELIATAQQAAGGPR